MKENPYEHRHRFGIDMPGSIGGLQIDDYVAYQKDGMQRSGYIYCFRQFGHTWFAWLYTDDETMQTVDCIPVEQLEKVKRDKQKYAINKFENWITRVAFRVA